MPEKSRGNSRDKKGQDQGKTRRDPVKDLPVRDAKAENVKGGAEPTGSPMGKKRQIND